VVAELIKGGGGVDKTLAMAMKIDSAATPNRMYATTSAPFPSV